MKAKTAAVGPAKGTRYPIWRTKAILLISIPVLVILTVLVFVLSDRSVFVETEITLLVISLCLFVFLAVGLYHGVRLERPKKEQLDRAAVEFESRDGAKGPSRRNFFDLLFFFDPTSLPHVDLPHIDLGDAASGGDDLIGCLLSLVLWIMVLLLIVAALWVLGQLLAALPVVMLALYWIFYRALRLVFSKSRVCRGHLLRSVGYSLLYAFLYVGWIAALLWLGRLMLLGLPPV